MKLIDKDALVAEIKKLKEKNKPSDKPICEYIKGGIYGFDLAIEKALSVLDTLEAKEVDLTEEIYFYIENSITGTNPIYTKGAVSNIIEKAAKHFFELGLKAKQS